MSCTPYRLRTDIDPVSETFLFEVTLEVRTSSTLTWNAAWLLCPFILMQNLYDVKYNTHIWLSTLLTFGSLYFIHTHYT